MHRRNATNEPCGFAMPYWHTACWHVKDARKHGCNVRHAVSLLASAAQLSCPIIVSGLVPHADVLHVANIHIGLSS